MKSFAKWLFALLAASLLAGCATNNSNSSSSSATPSVSGYVDTSAQKHL